MSGIGREALLDDRHGREALLDIREWYGGLPDFLEWSGDSLERPGVVGRPSRMFGSCWETLTNIRE